VVTATTTGAVTAFKSTNYRSATCTGTVTSVQALGDTSQGVCTPTPTPKGTPQTYFTVTYSTSLALTGGTIFTGNATAADCTAADPTKLAIGYQFLAPTCGGSTIPRNTSLAVAGVCGMPLAPVKTLLYAAQTVTSATLTLAIAQTPTFKKNFASAVATTLGVPTSSVNVTGVSQVSSRRALLAGIQVRYNVVTTSAALATALSAALSSNSGAVAGVLANTYTGVTVATPTVSANSAAPTNAPVVSAMPTIAPVKSAARAAGAVLATAISIATAWLVW
jgi:hypothetical protein